MATSASVVPILNAALVHEKRSSTADRVAADTAVNSNIRIVSPHEYKQAARCLAEAFRDDHVVRYAIDTPDRTHWSEVEKFDLFTQMMEYITYATCLKGLVTTVGPDYDCVALWNPPGKNLNDWMTIFRSGLWRLHFQLGTEGRNRHFNEFIPLLTRTVEEVMGKRAKNCWYLNYIGTKVESRGRGYARKLIEHITSRADLQGQPCYLESSHHVNLIIYGKLGFKFVKPVYLVEGDDDLKMDIMIREPSDHRIEPKFQKV